MGRVRRLLPVDVRPGAVHGRSAAARAMRRREDDRRVSSPEETKQAADLIERLLTDAAFRAEFRRDPASACERFGLTELAQELRGSGSAKALYTLELRQSMSSLAGVIMAAAAEGIGALDLAGFGSAATSAVAGVVNEALSRHSIKAISQAQMHAVTITPPRPPATGITATSARGPIRSTSSARAAKHAGTHARSRRRARRTAASRQAMLRPRHEASATARRRCRPAAHHEEASPRRRRRLRTRTTSAPAAHEGTCRSRTRGRRSASRRRRAGAPSTAELAALLENPNLELPGRRARRPGVRPRRPAARLGADRADEGAQDRPLGRDHRARPVHVRGVGLEPLRRPRAGHRERGRGDRARRTASRRASWRRR